jgi:RecB family exonuclease
VRMMRDREPEWLEVEYAFGGKDRQVSLPVNGGRMRFRGKIDRLDRRADGSLGVVDYKTGSVYGYVVKRPFAGGRRIQHYLYAVAAEEALGGTVTSAEYHFPTAKGENQVVAFRTESDLVLGGTLLLSLHALGTGGAFVATEDASDCRYCDYAAICRATEDRFRRIHSPEAKWSKAHLERNPEHRHLTELREIDG